MHVHSKCVFKINKSLSCSVARYCIKPFKQQRPVKKRRNDTLTHTYYWGICVYTLSAWECVCIPIYMFLADTNYACILVCFFLSCTVTWSLLCWLWCFSLLSLIFVANSLRRQAQTGSNNIEWMNEWIVHDKETILCDKQKLRFHV